jgi:hypothetical protein
VNPAAQAKFIRDSLPPGGLFAGQEWRIKSPLASPARQR